MKAKSHYTGPTGPARTRTTRISEKLRWSVRVSDKVRAGPRGSGRARLVEFSLSPTKFADFVRSGPVGSVQWNLAITIYSGSSHATLIAVPYQTRFCARESLRTGLRRYRAAGIHFSKVTS